MAAADKKSAEGVADSGRAAEPHPAVFANRMCPACMEYRQLLVKAQDIILKYQSKFRALESSLDAETLTALRQLQSLEYLCRESIRLGRGVYEEDISRLASRAKKEITMVFEGVGFGPDWGALAAGESCADQIIEAFNSGMADPVAKTMPKVSIQTAQHDSSSEIESDSTRNYEDLLEDDQISMDSSIVSE